MDTATGEVAIDRIRGRTESEGMRIPGTWRTFVSRLPELVCLCCLTAVPAGGPPAEWFDTAPASSSFGRIALKDLALLRWLSLRAWVGCARGITSGSVRPVLPVRPHVVNARDGPMRGSR